MADYSSLITQAETNYGLPPGMLNQLLQTESGLNPNAVNKSTGATGIAQALPSTAKDPGYGIRAFDPTDPAASIDFAGHYLQVLKNQTGSWEGALRHYGTLAGKAGMAYDAAPQNANQALLLSLARHGDPTQAQVQPPQPAQAPGQVMRSAPDPTQRASQPVVPPAEAYAGLPPLANVLNVGSQYVSDAIKSATGWTPGTTPAWVPAWLTDASRANTEAEQQQFENFNAYMAPQYKITPQQWHMLMGLAGPIEAWHGSASDFEAFKPGFELTGEGDANAGFAPGGYHADAASKSTAEIYQDPYLYQTRINAEPEDFLHWHEPLGEQDPDIRKTLSDLIAPRTAKEMKAVRTEYKQAADALRLNPNDPIAKAAFEKVQKDFDVYTGLVDGSATGEDIYNYLMRDSGETDQVAQQRYATQQLSEAGFPGIRYYDEGTYWRGMPRGDYPSNYAVFDPDIVDILNKFRAGD